MINPRRLQTMRQRQRIRMLFEPAPRLCLGRGPDQARRGPYATRWCGRWDMLSDAEQRAYLCAGQLPGDLPDDWLA